MPSGYDNCTEVTDYCKVEHTTYGYTPNKGGNVFLTIWFAVIFLVTVAQGIRFKSLWYNWWIAIGAIGEMAGFVGRVIMSNNPWDDNGFMCQIAALIFSPSFFAAAIYLTLKHMVRAVGPAYSPVPASIYAWLFIICDLISLLLQAAGGGVAAGANDDKTSAAGGHIMLAGICFQVVTFTFLYSLVGWIVWRMYKVRHSIKPEVMSMLRSRDFKIFAGGIFAASLAIYVRCVYRIAELAGGWANHIMRNQAEYVILDNVMIAIAGLLLCVAHPGYWFKCMLTKQYPAIDPSRFTDDDKHGSSYSGTHSPALAGGNGYEMAKQANASTEQVGSPRQGERMV